MESHEAIFELIAGYALGALSEEDRRTAEGHLPTCAECRALLAEYGHVTDEMAHAVGPLEAPVKLEADLRARLTHKRRAGPMIQTRFRLWQPLALAVALALFVGVGLWMALPWLTADHDTRLAEAILADTAAVRIPLRADEIAGDAIGEVVLGRDEHTFVVVVSGLLPLPDEQVYQLWLVDGDHRDNGGIYWAEQDIWLVQAPRAIFSYDALGVTIEPPGGSPGPTGPRVLSTTLTEVD